MRKLSICSQVLILLLFTLGLRPLLAQSHADVDGQWVLNLGPRTLMILSIKPSSIPTQAVSGSVVSEHFQTANSRSFSHVGGGIMTKAITSAAWKGNALALTLQNVSNPTDKDEVTLTFEGPDHAQLLLAQSFPPLDLVRTHASPALATDWDKDKTYSPDDGFQSNPEMKRIFDEDQKPRRNGLNIDWSVVGKADAERRKQTMKLLDEGALHTGEDFTFAAFIFQHGDTPDDYLLAHTLIMVALGKGYGGALWMASATLDRYLQSIHQPQIYGTQYSTAGAKPTTQGLYNDKLISDALRRQLADPTIPEQQVRRAEYDKERNLAK